MRPIRITGVTGTSVTVPLDVYSPSPALVTISSAGTPNIQITADDVFNSAITPQWETPSPAFAANTPYQLPYGTRGVRGTGMVGADIMSVSQQGIA